MCGYICLKKELHKRRSSFGIKIEWSHCRWEHRNPDSSCNAWHCSYFTQKVAKIQFSAKQKYSTSQNTNWTISSMTYYKILDPRNFRGRGKGYDHLNVTFPIRLPPVHLSIHPRFSYYTMNLEWLNIYNHGILVRSRFQWNI